MSKLAAGPGAGRYYVDRVAHGREDYYAGEGEVPGTWMGSGAATLGLAGEVSEQGVVRLLDARDPATGELLREPLTSGAVAGFDLTFRAPKSVSILLGLPNPRLRERSSQRTTPRSPKRWATWSARRAARAGAAVAQS